MNDRRRFLQIFGASAMTAAGTACGVSLTNEEGMGGGGSSGTGTTTATTGAATTTAAGGGTTTAAGGGTTTAAGGGTTTSTSAGGGTTTAAGGGTTTSTSAGGGTTSTTSTGAGTTSTTSTGGSNCVTTPAGESIGAETQFSATGIFEVSGKSLLIGRDSGGLVAMTSICTHQQCDMDGSRGQISGSQIECLCHGSVFSVDGTVVQGPAKKSLTCYALAKACDGNLYVDTSKTVANTVRFTG